MKYRKYSVQAEFAAAVGPSEAWLSLYASASIKREGTKNMAHGMFLTKHQCFICVFKE